MLDETVANHAFTGGSVIFVFYLSQGVSRSLFNGDVMTNHDCIEELASLFDVAIPEAHRLLKSFSGAMVAELLAHKKLVVRGLGTFTVTHVSPAKKSTDSGIVYMPPCNRLMFDSRLSGIDDTVRIAVSRIAMSPDEAARFARSLTAVLGGAFQQQREILLNGFGRFSFEEGRYRFVPERALEELLNREYQDLDEVVVSQQDRVLPASERRAPPFELPIMALVLAGLLLAAFYGRQMAELVFPSSVKIAEHSQLATVPELKADNKEPHIAAAVQPGVPDSVVLEKDDYTIVLATFRSEKSALKERVSLRSEGIISFVWPAFLDGTKYFRLMTGRFSNREKASAHLKGMAAKKAGSAYIQHVIKRVVLHGEKEL
jgi:nucleoid DNA-binding protein